jgi:dipeptidyl aminopeptidase/acylaminoacyl peptidase
MFASLLMVGVTASAAPPPVGDFFKPATYENMSLSPSGKLLAATIPASNGRRALAIVDLNDFAKSKIVAAYSDADIWGVRWVNDERLVYHLWDERQTLWGQRGTGLFAVDTDGKAAPRELIRPGWLDIREGSHITSRVLEPNYYLNGVLRDGSDDILINEFVGTNWGEPLRINLHRLNTRTGALRNLSNGAPDHGFYWIVDRQGRPRIVRTRFEGKDALYWRASDESPWTKIDEGAAFEVGVPHPVYVESDHRVYAVARVAPHTDIESLVVMDPTAGAGKLKVDALLSAPGFDFSGRVIRSRSGAVVGVSYLTEASGTHWFDPAMKKIQETVDSLLPGTNNVLDCGDCTNVDNVLVTSTSDRSPAVYRLFRVGKNALEPIVASRPWIKPQEMATTDLVRIPARDGLNIPVYVTRPVGLKGPAPTVVLVHGGPWVRGRRWEWNAQSQFLASRGYVVVEPEFRGSTGYGFKLYRAGFKQWGLAMQDDVADATQWAIKQGYADATRVCVAGASYGGYATLMGLARNPELFRCGVDWVGVTDIDLMYSIHWSDSSESWKQFGMPVMIGDREKDAAQLAATSPIKLAAKITQPLFMAYGSIDRRVPLEHGTQMRDAIRKTNQNVEWKVYTEEGHGWVLPANNIDFWTRVETFLDKNLKSAP